MQQIGAWLEAINAAIPQGTVALIALLASLSFLCRFYWLRRDVYLYRSWSSFGLAGTLLSFFLLYAGVRLNIVTFPPSTAAAILRLILLLHFIGILHHNIGYVRYTLQPGKR